MSTPAHDLNDHGQFDAVNGTDERASVRRQLESRRDLGAHLFSYLVVNAALVFTWAMTGGGYFWPAWVLGFWGIGLVMHGWDAFVRRPVTEDEVDEAMRRRHAH